MPLQVKIETNLHERDLTIEDCSAIIEELQRSYRFIKNDIYNQYFSIKHLRNELIFIAILFFFYLASEDMLFVYMMPLSFLATMIFNIISAELVYKKVKEQVTKQIEHFKELKQKLLAQKQFNS